MGKMLSSIATHRCRRYVSEDGRARPVLQEVSRLLARAEAVVVLGGENPIFIPVEKDKVPRISLAPEEVANLYLPWHPWAGHATFSWSIYPENQGARLSPLEQTSYPGIRRLTLERTGKARETVVHFQLWATQHVPRPPEEYLVREFAVKIT